MRILYDHQAFTGTSHSGISRFFAEIIGELKLISDVKPIVKIVFSNNHHLKSIKKQGVISIPKLGPPRLMPTIASQFNKINALNALRKKNFDVFHPTYFHNYFLENIKKPFVVTFHDTAAEDFPEFESLGANFDLRKKTLEKATRIIAISECTKADILRHYDINPTKIDVIYHATRFDQIEPKKIEILPEKYILYVGQRGLYKNFNGFLTNTASFLKQENISLVCIGGGEFNAEENLLFKSLGVQNLVQKINAESDNSLKFAYQKAFCFVYPSKLEGFGIPILEAFAAQCPVLLSDIPIFREVADNAAIFFDLNNIDSLQNALKGFLTEANRQEFIQKGSERLTHFSWKKSAQQTLETYQKCISKNADYQQDTNQL